MVLQALLTFVEHFRFAAGVFYVGNIAMALVRGHSDNADLDYLSRLIQGPSGVSNALTVSLPCDCGK